MAKSDSFFIRAIVSTDTINFAQTSIDLGAYVDALGKSVLRIHNVAVKYGGPLASYSGPAGSNHTCAFQLTTQSQTALVDVTDKSVISTGVMSVSTDAGTTVTMMNDSMDIAPQNWTNGYLVGVEQIYLGVDQSADIFDDVGIDLECTVETLSSSAAMALALSQQ